MLNDTIVAISTSTLSAAAINVIRLSGDSCFDVLDRIFVSKDKNYEGYRIYYGFIVDPETNEKVDEVLVNAFRNPRSFTGEDMAEISCHGGLYVTRKILTLCLSYGARQALKGEFTKRAFLNGKIDLTQAEAINDLIVADNKDNAKLAMNSLTGSIRKLLEPMIDAVEQCVAHIEVNIDYPEYDDNGIITANQVKELVEKWLKESETILNVAESSIVVKEGIKTVIVGKPNVGKSSLLNALLDQDKAIVSDIAGTTRDLVEGEVRLSNVTLHLIDTAGIRETDSSLEQMGIKKSKEALEQAQLVIVVLDSSDIDEEDHQLLEETKEYNRIVVYNKSDIRTSADGITISASNNDISQLVDKINEMFEDNRIALSQPALTNERQISLMRRARQSMESALQALNDEVPLDLVTEDIQNSYRYLKEILGEYSREDLLDGIFSRFCVGK
ncbi:MAG TPA: tRNA uridine-5-carboxymethylaminomethyl(34) synthesis GTPase MnmE [Erysipelotrichaceae bacterium]|nr:tRNA uridine-5-carboxymethylaminomethyl(34) synthesis GTPase MnmE [Erysipelotrichaceae bacterium]HQB32096.1 tRNA uridine-5-carboxymethylaminomethyl(34) synthesis GTPase MnmE [Erysipelotrichaceae bacterium]